MSVREKRETSAPVREETKPGREGTEWKRVPPPITAKLTNPKGLDELAITQCQREAAEQQRRREEDQKKCLTSTYDMTEEDEKLVGNYAAQVPPCWRESDSDEDAWLQKMGRTSCRL